MTTEHAYTKSGLDESRYYVIICKLHEKELGQKNIS